jgi:hypothetical protein
MSKVSSNQDAVSRLASQADAIGRLAQDTGGFAAVLAAFESKDPNAFRWVLDRLEMLPYCELICEWVRIKLCVLRCVEVCGPPRDGQAVPSLEEFAHAAVRLSSNQKILRRVVDAVSCGDASAYHAAIREIELESFCHLICQWVCSVGYRRVCEVVCRPGVALLADAESELVSTGKVLAALIANKRAMEAISESVADGNCAKVQAAINEAGFVSGCETICLFFCIWRRVWVCRALCQDPPFVLTGAYAVEEAKSFALAARQLAAQPRALADLVGAVQTMDAEVYRRVISRFGLGPYCWQVCAWVSSVTCFEFCYCVCPPSAFPPLFTQVGNFDIYNDIDPTTGLTNKQVPSPFPVDMPFGGGPNFSFFGQLQLGGWCPATSPTFSGQPMMYRFLYATNLTTLASPITSAAQLSIVVPSSAGIPAIGTNISICYSDLPYETVEIMTVTAVSTTTWTVTRGVDGTTAAAFVPAGATVAINPLPMITQVDKPVLVGQRIISWPNPSLIGSSPTLENVYVGPGTDPLPPTALPWYSPAHYIQPDLGTGWVNVDQNLVAGGVSIFLNFNSADVTTATCEIPAPCFAQPGSAPAGTAVPPGNQGVGTDFAIIFQATRQAVPTPVDYSNSLCRIHINNFPEVNNLWLVEFDTPGTTCCTPINSDVSVQVTADHEMMYSGGWSLDIESCATIPPLTNPLNPTASISAQSTTLTGPINNSVTSIPVASVAGFPSAPFILVVGTETMVVTSASVGTFTVVRGENGTPAAALAGATATYPGLTVTTRGVAATIVEDTQNWTNCSYRVELTARAGLTTGLSDNDPGPNLLTFCICGHGSLPAPAAESQAKKR